MSSNCRHPGYSAARKFQSSDTSASRSRRSAYLKQTMQPSGKTVLSGLTATSRVAFVHLRSVFNADNARLLCCARLAHLSRQKRPCQASPLPVASARLIRTTPPGAGETSCSYRRLPLALNERCLSDRALPFVRFFSGTGMSGRPVGTQQRPSQLSVLTEHLACRQPSALVAVWRRAQKSSQPV